MLHFFKMVISMKAKLWGQYPGKRGNIDSILSKSFDDNFSLKEKPHFYLVTATINGIIKDDIHINFYDDKLSVYICVPLFKGSYFKGSIGKKNFQKTITIPKKVDEKNISYIFERSKLSIWLPKIKDEGHQVFWIKRLFGRRNTR